MQDAAKDLLNAEDKLGEEQGWHGEEFGVGDEAGPAVIDGDL